MLRAAAIRAGRAGHSHFLFSLPRRSYSRSTKRRLNLSSMAERRFSRVSSEARRARVKSHRAARAMMMTVKAQKYISVHPFLEPLFPYAPPQGGMPVEMGHRLPAHGCVVAFAPEEILYRLNPIFRSVHGPEAIVRRFQAPRGGGHFPLVVRHQFRPAGIVSRHTGDAAGKRL